MICKFFAWRTAVVAVFCIVMENASTTTAKGIDTPYTPVSVEHKPEIDYPEVPKTIEEALRLIHESGMDTAAEFPVLSIDTFPVGKRDSKTIVEDIRILAERVEQVYGAEYAKLFQAILRGEIVEQKTDAEAARSVDPLAEIILERISKIHSPLRSGHRRANLGRDHEIMLDTFQTELIREINTRILLAARFLLYAISYLPQTHISERQEIPQWYGCVSDPHEFITCLIHAAVCTPMLKTFPTIAYLETQNFFEQYMTSLSLAYVLPAEIERSSMADTLHRAFKIHSYIGDIRGEEMLDVALDMQNPFGNESGILLRASDHELIECLRQAGPHKVSLTAVAVSSIVELHASRQISQGYSLQHMDSKQKTHVVQKAIVPEALELNGPPVNGSPYRFNLSGEPSSHTELIARRAFYVVYPLAIFSLLDGVVIDYLADLALRTIDPATYQKAYSLRQSAMALHIGGRQVHPQLLSNEATILAWGLAVWMQRSFQGYLDAHPELEYELTQTFARVKGLTSTLIKAQETSNFPARPPLTFSIWQELEAEREALGDKLTDDNNPFASLSEHFSTDTLGITFGLIWDPEKTGLLLQVLKDFTRSHPALRELDFHDRYAQAERKMQHYFAVHGNLLCLQTSTQELDTVDRQSSFECHFLAHSLVQRYLAQHLAYALAKTDLLPYDLPAIQKLYGEIIVHVALHKETPAKAAALIATKGARFDISVDGQTVSSSIDMNMSDIGATLHGGLIFDQLFEIFLKRALRVTRARVLRESKDDTEAVEIVTSEAERHLLALIRHCPYLEITTWQEGTIRPDPIALHVPIPLTALQQDNSLPTQVMVLTGVEDIVSLMRAKSPRCLGSTQSEQGFVDSIALALEEYFFQNGEEWYLAFSSGKGRQGRGSYKLARSVLKHFEQYRDRHNKIADDILLSADMLGQKKAIVFLQRITDRARTCGLYRRTCENPSNPISNPEELIRLIMIASSAGDQVSASIEYHIFQQIQNRHVTAETLLSCAQRASELYLGQGHNPRTWIESYLANYVGKILPDFAQRFILGSVDWIDWADEWLDWARGK